MKIFGKRLKTQSTSKTRLRVEHIFALIYHTKKHNI